MTEETARRRGVRLGCTRAPRHVLVQRLLVGALAVALVATPGRAAAQDPAIRTTPQGVILNFQDTDIAYVFSALAAAVGMNIVYYDLPQKNVTMRTVQPVSTQDLRNLIQNLAAANQITVIQDGIFLRLQGSGSEDPPDDRRLYIYRLKHARAPILASTLQQLFGGPGTANITQQGRGGLSQRLQQLQQQQQGGRGNAAQAQQQAAALRAQQLLIQGGMGGLLGNVLIVPDESTNSLLIRASPQDYEIIIQAIQGLDLRPLQVVIEVVVAEVRRSDDLNVGLRFAAIDDDDDEVRGELRTGLPAQNAPDDFSLTILTTGDVNVEATLSALSATGNVRIVSRPVVQAQNNQEASIIVGSEQPFISLSQGSAIDPTFVTQSVQYREVGTILTILPTINPDGYVNLALTQEVSSATSQTQFGAPIITTREATTQLLARNGQTIVIGGLVDRSEEHSRVGIPFLKDIPILGLLFGSTRTTEGTNELFLFLTPHIVANDADADRIRDEIERNAELLQSIVPISPLIPPVGLPDTIGGAGAGGRGAGRGG